MIIIFFFFNKNSITVSIVINKYEMYVWLREVFNKIEFYQTPDNTVKSALKTKNKRKKYKNNKDKIESLKNHIKLNKMNFFYYHSVGFKKRFFRTCAI